MTMYLSKSLILNSFIFVTALLFTFCLIEGYLKLLFYIFQLHALDDVSRIELFHNSHKINDIPVRISFS